MAKAASLLAKLDPAITRLAAGLVAIGLLGWSGLRAARRTALADKEARTLNSTLSAFADFRKRYSPAAAAESIAWRRTWMELQDLGTSGDERLAMTQSVALAAESAGLRDVKVLIAGSDTTRVDKRHSKGGVGRRSASFSLNVECRGSMASILTFLGRLPPSVTATQLAMTRLVEGGARHRISLAVYEITFDNGPPTGLWAPAERRGDRARGDSRPGG